MEAFLRRYLPCMIRLWDYIWPPAAGGPPREVKIHTVSTPTPRAQEAGKVPAIDRSHKPLPLTPTVDSALPKPAVSLVYAALYDFEARCDEEMSVLQGERLVVLSEDGDFVKARKLSGPPSEGFVPTTYVTVLQDSLLNEPWYFGEMSRMEAEKLLFSPPNKNGSFLVRRSETSGIDYSLSVRSKNAAHHFQVFTHPNGNLYLHKVKEFSNITDLINYYKQNSKALQFPLSYPCIQEDWHNLEEWERPRKEFLFIRKLGEGNFGAVWEGLWKKKYRVAIKVIKGDYTMHEELVKEVLALKSLQHPNVIRLYAICTIGAPMYIVTELMTKGNLKTYLGTSEGRTLTIMQLVHMAHQIAEGMEYLEKRNIVHRDLAARNILVGENLVCKVADFGLARRLKMEVGKLSKKVKIPVKWTAPEAAAYQRYSVKSDVWSFGILLYEMVTYGGTPYGDMTNTEVLSQVAKGYRMPCPESCIPQVYSFMLECWDAQEEKRPSFSVVQQRLDLILKHLNQQSKSKH